jgi:hypothetical protein
MATSRQMTQRRPTKRRRTERESKHASCGGCAARSSEPRGGQSGFFDRGLSISRTSEKTSVEWSGNALSRPAKVVGDQKDCTKRFKYVEFREAQLVPR